MKIHNYYLFIIILGMLASCGSTVKVNKLSTINDLEENAVVYALPKTSIQINVEAKKITTKKGPFYLFAEEYLGKDNAVTRDKIQWKIQDISLSTSPLLDTSQYYVIQSGKSDAIENINLTEEGVLVGLNQDTPVSFPTSGKKFIKRHKQKNLTPYSDLTAKKNIKEKVDTVYRGSDVDTMFLKVPSIRKDVVEKNISEKAQEAANFIFELREKRYNLLTASAQNAPEGDALDKMLTELDKLESHYMSLFVGMRTTKHVDHTFTFIPSEGGEISQKLIFRFSEARGILPPDSKIGTPVYLDSKKYNQVSALNRFNRMQKNSDSETKGLIYRVPDRAKIRLMRDREVMLEKTIKVAQYGNTVTLPARFITPDKAISFYPHLGTIKAIKSRD